MNHFFQCCPIYFSIKCSSQNDNLIKPYFLPFTKSVSENNPQCAKVKIKTVDVNKTLAVDKLSEIKRA